MGARCREFESPHSDQLGAYRLLTNAKKKADKNPGYYVFDNDGVAFYTQTASTDAPTDETVQESYAIHTVVRGDSLWKIAMKYLGKGIRYKDIKFLNGLTSDTIYVGQKLKIPK